MKYSYEASLVLTWRFQIHMADDNFPRAAWCLSDPGKHWPKYEIDFPESMALMWNRRPWNVYRHPR